jgi:hypothetical protein
MNAARTREFLDIAADVRRPEPLQPIGRYAPIPSAGPTWTYDDEHAALRQGWLIDYTLTRIRAARGEKPSDRLNWSCDEAARAFVGARAVCGDELACRALLFIADHCGVMGQVRHTAAARTA